MQGACSTLKGTPATVSVTADSLTWTSGSKTRVVKFEDVLSAVAATPHLMLSSSPAGRSSPAKPAKQGLAQAVEEPNALPPAMWVVYCVPRHGIFGAKERRFREYAFKAADPAAAQSWVRAIQDGAFGGPPKKKRVLILVNPVSGSGKSRQTSGQLVPLLKAGGVEYDVQETTHAGHAVEIGRNLDRARYDMALTIGGDGILHELLNGLLSRPDWAAAVTLPLLPVPAGTGNGLAHSLGISDVHTAALVAVRGKSRPMDVAGVLQEGAAGAPLQRVAFSFLSLTWAIIADVDLGTEGLRWMGDLRNTVGGLKAIMARKLYRGRISMYTGKSGEGVLKTAHGPLRLPPVPFEAPTPLTTAPEAERASTLRRCGGACEHCRRALDTAQPGPPSPRGGGGTGPACRVDFAGARKGEPGPGWTVIEGEFLLFLASNTTLIASDFCGTPFAHLSDGHFDVLLVRKASRGALLGAFLKAETGEVVSEPVSEYYKCTALLVEPEAGQEGYVALDGERLPYRPVALEVHRGLARAAYWEHQQPVEQRLPRDRPDRGGAPCF